MKLLAIDPGAHGGLAWIIDGVISCAKMPEGMTAQVELLRDFVGFNAVMEKVGWWMPGDHPNSATKFARHCGNLEAALYAFGIPTEQFIPNKWMSNLGVTWPSDKEERKRAIKEMMQRKYPHLKVTLDTSDALGLLTWKLAQQP